MKRYEAFSDPGYYDMFGVGEIKRNGEKNSFYDIVHVQTVEEARWLVDRLNELERITDAAKRALILACAAEIKNDEVLLFEGEIKRLTDGVQGVKRILLDALSQEDKQ